MPGPRVVAKSAIVESPQNHVSVTGVAGSYNQVVIRAGDFDEPDIKREPRESGRLLNGVGDPVSLPGVIERPAGINALVKRYLRW